MKLIRKKSNNDLLEEAEVQYSFKQIDPNQNEYEYELQHIPTNKTFQRKVWCYSKNDFYKLLANWNRANDWKVYSKSLEQIANAKNIIKKATKYKVVDSEFNRKNYPDMIGQILNDPPSYAHVKQIEEEKPSLKEIYDFQSKMFTHPKSNTMPEDFIIKALKAGYDKDAIIKGLQEFYRQAPDAGNSMFNRTIVKLKNE